MSQLFRNSFVRSRDFIVRIRNAEPAVRKRWLVIFTVPTFALVIVLWGFSMTAGFRGADAGGGRAQENVGFFEVFGAGFRAVGSQVSRGAARVWRFLDSRLAGPTISVNVSERNFIAEGLEIIPPTPLP